jgi:hypothetical protein
MIRIYLENSKNPSYNMNPKIISYSKGPQFRGGNAVAPFLLVMLLIVFSVISVINYATIFLLFTIPLLVFLINFILDIQGVEIDKTKGLVREYKLEFFLKIGEWQDLKKFNKITLDKEHYIIQQVTIYSQMARTNGGKGITDEKHSRFLISLIYAEPQKSIILLEKNNYWEAVELSLQISKNLNLPYDDLFDTKLMNSRNRRR